MFFVTMQPAPIIAPAPITTDESTTELLPSQQSGPIMVCSYLGLFNALRRSCVLEETSQCSVDCPHWNAPIDNQSLGCSNPPTDTREPTSEYAPNTVSET